MNKTIKSPAGNKGSYAIAAAVVDIKKGFMLNKHQSGIRQSFKSATAHSPNVRRHSRTTAV